MERMGLRKGQKEQGFKRKTFEAEIIKGLWLSWIWLCPTFPINTVEDTFAFNGVGNSIPMDRRLFLSILGKILFVVDGKDS